MSAGWYYRDPPLPQQGAKIAPTIPGPVVNNPPPRSAAVLLAAIAIWQPVYDHTPYSLNNRGAHIAPLIQTVVSQPPRVRAAQFAAIRASWADATWPAQTFPDSAHFAGSGGAAARPYSIAANLAAIQLSWPPVTWPTQSLIEDLVQPFLGDEPPGAPAVPDVADYYPDPWRAQSAPPVAGLLAIAAAAQVPGAAFPVAIGVAWNLAPSWSAQSALKIAATAPAPVVNNPPLVTFATLYALRAAWPDVTWPVQKAAPAAAVVQVIAPAPQPAVSAAAFYAQRAAWPDVTWPVQTFADVAGVAPAPPVVNNPPPTSLAPFYALRATWADPSWPAQTFPDSAAQVPPPAAPAPPYVATVGFSAILQSWIVLTWGAQAAPPIAGALPPIVNPPPPTSGARGAALRAAWPEVAWAAQSGARVAPLVPPPVVNNPPPYTVVGLALTRSRWVDATWSAQFLTSSTITIGGTPGTGLNEFIAATITISFRAGTLEDFT